MVSAASLTATDKARLHGHTQQIISRLLQGPASNRELSAISLKYTGRISDARKLGYRIECERLAGGLTEYRLVGLPGGAPYQLELVLR